MFDLDGAGRPGFHVRYVRKPRADGSGEPVRLGGTAFVQVVLRGIGLPDDTGVPGFGDAATRVPGSAASAVVEVAPGATFEGDQLAFIALIGRPRSLRAFTLTDPTRVVVDVRDE